MSETNEIELLYDFQDDSEVDEEGNIFQQSRLLKFICLDCGKIDEIESKGEIIEVADEGIKGMIILESPCKDNTQETKTMEMLGRKLKSSQPDLFRVFKMMEEKPKEK